MGKLCQGCYGSGKVIGAGMMQTECDQCNGKGNITEIEYDIEELNLIHSESYKNAIKEIKACDPAMTDDKAKELFKKEYKKLSKK